MGHPSANDNDAAGAHVQQNRLTIGHLLLWLATTSLVFATMQRNKPGPPESIVITRDLTEAETEEFDLRRREAWRVSWIRYLVSVAVAPVTGAMYAAALLATWRLLTRRFGFPTQPGHWLLLVGAGMVVVAMVRPRLQWRLSPDVAQMVVAAASALIFIIAVMHLRGPRRWRIAFAFPLCTFVAALLAFSIKWLSSANQVPAFFPLAVFPLLAFPFVGLICAAIDVTERSRYDVFHWIGVVALMGIIAFFFAFFALPQ